MVVSACQREFTRAGVPPVKFKLVASVEPTAPSDIILRKERGSVVALINPSWGHRRLTAMQDRLACHVYWFSQTNETVQQIVADLTDGNAPSAARYKFATNSSQCTPIPDAHFFTGQGFEATYAFAVDHAPAWDDRQGDIIWRGGMNGVGLFSLEKSGIDNAGVIQRLRMALKCQELGIDFRFMFNKSQAFCHVLRNAGLTGQFIPTREWANMKYAIDIDGYTNTWSNLLERMKLGCCVLKVDSQFGFYQWYYHNLVAWEHYVPIRADLSDLQEQIDWVKSNPGKARQIAQQGQVFAASLTFESERQFAIEAIEEREARA